MGVPQILTHICGEQNRNLILARNTTWKARYLELWSQVDIDIANNLFGKDNLIMGNVKTTSIMVGKFEEVLEISKECLEKGKKVPAGFILSLACEIGPATPTLNVYAMVKAAKEYGVY